MKQPLLNYKLNENNEMGVLFLTSASKTCWPGKRNKQPHESLY